MVTPTESGTKGMSAVTVNISKPKPSTATGEKKSKWLMLKDVALLVVLLMNVGFQLSILFTQKRAGTRVLACVGLFFSCIATKQNLAKNDDKNKSHEKKSTWWELIELCGFVLSSVTLGFSVGLLLAL